MITGILRQAFFGMIAGLNRLVPKREILVLSAFPDVEDQVVAVIRHATRSLPGDWRIVLLVAGSTGTARAQLVRLIDSDYPRVEVMAKMSGGAIWTYLRASVVCFTHGLYGFYRTPRSQTVVNLWHGMPLKRIWRGLPNSHVPPCDFLLCTSELFRGVLRDASGMSADRILPIGLPRNDLLLSKRPETRCFRERIREGVDRVLLFLPTYRKSVRGFAANDGSESADALAMDAEDAENLRQTLVQTRTRLLVKPHPMSGHHGDISCVDNHLWIVTDSWFLEQGVTLYEGLGVTDGLITDISSVYVDFITLNRPVIFYFPDLDEYRKTRKFLLEPIEQWLAGPLCRTPSELCAAVIDVAAESGVFAEARARLGPVLNQTPRDSADRLFEHLRQGRRPFVAFDG